MEFRYGLWTGVSSVFGEDGRQLGEQNTRPGIFDHQIETETHICKYSGSRNGELINISALRAAMAYFYEACAITVAVRDYHMARVGKSSTDHPGIWDLHVISRASLALIAYRYRAGKLSADDRLPSGIASQFKFVTGLFVITREMTNAGHPAIKTNSQVTSQELYKFVDDNDHFRSDAGMVCAGSTSKIIEFMDFAVKGRDHPNNEKLKWDGADDHQALLNNFVPDLESWYRYALLTIELDCFVEVEILSRQINAEPTNQNRVQPVLDIYRSKREYWVELLGDQEQGFSENFEQGLLDRQNAILALLNMPLLRKIPNYVKTARLIP